MEQVAGVQSARVTMNDRLTTLELKPGNTVTLAALRQVITSKGFEAKDARVVARGSAGGTRTFVVSGTNEALTLSAAPAQVADGWKLMVPAPKK